MSVVYNVNYGNEISDTIVTFHLETFLKGLISSVQVISNSFFFNFYFLNLFDLQCCVSFWYTASNLVLHTYTYVCPFSYSSPLWFITGY